MGYLKALHIVFIVTWLAGLFYIPRLFIYATEAGNKDQQTCTILRAEFNKMACRLWYGITWPSAIITAILGITLLIQHGWLSLIFHDSYRWLLYKLLFVLGLYLYHYSLHYIFKQQSKGIFKYSSQQLRIWNEVSTVFLVAIVMLVVVKQGVSIFWGLFGLIVLIVLLMTAIKVYKYMRR